MKAAAPYYVLAIVFSFQSHATWTRREPVYWAAVVQFALAIIAVIVGETAG